MSNLSNSIGDNTTDLNGSTELSDSSTSTSALSGSTGISDSSTRTSAFSGISDSTGISDSSTRTSALSDTAVKSTSSIIKNTFNSVFGLTKKVEPEQVEKEKQKSKKGNKDYFISYTFPWILYFYPDPKKDPNYVLLDPENDKKKLNKLKVKILSFISFAIFIGILYAFWQSGSLFPALHTMWFFFWRYMTLIIFFLCFMIVIAILKGFPFFTGKIMKYMELTINPLKHKPAYDAYKKYGSFFKPIITGFYSFVFALFTFAWIVITIIVLLPIYGVFATLCGLLLGDLNTSYFAFGMGEYEVTETGKKSMQKRMENSTGITAAKETVSSGISQLKKLSDLRFMGASELI